MQSDPIGRSLVVMEGGCEVLLFGTMGDIGQTVSIDFHRHGIDAVSVDFPQNTFRDEPGYRRELLKAVRRYSPSMIIPIGSQLAMARFKDRLPAGIIVPVESEEKIALLESKVDCSVLAESLGIAQPRIFLSSDVTSDSGSLSSQMQDILSDADFPVIFKRDRSFGGSGVYRPRTREALVRLIGHEPAGRYLVEEYVDGYDCSVDAIRWHGFFAAGCYKALANHGQGPATERKSVQMPMLCNIARHILEHLDYNGVCGMDFRMSQSGVPLFLECNPRFTGGITTQIEAGFDLPFLLYSVAKKGQVVTV